MPINWIDRVDDKEIARREQWLKDQGFTGSDSCSFRVCFDSFYLVAYACGKWTLVSENPTEFYGHYEERGLNIDFDTHSDAEIKGFLEILGLDVDWDK